MGRIFIVTILVLFNLFGCGEGGSEDSNKPKPPVPPKVKLVPLKMKITDMNNKPLDYVDVSLVGSHFWYKIVLTNPNPVGVNILYIGWDENWAMAKARDDGISLKEFVGRYSPGWVIGLFTPTKNPDDCLNIKNDKNIKRLAPNSSCAFYTYALNLGTNHNIDQDTFPEYIAYKIEAIDDEKNSLQVEQCSKIKHKEEYDCSNEKNPEYSQFSFKYKMKPAYMGDIDADQIPVFIRGISMNGKALYSCDGNGRDYPVCDLYSLNYDKEKNFLQQSKKPIKQFTLEDNYVIVTDISPSNDGSSAWVTLYGKDSTEHYALVNTNNPSIILRECAGDYKNLPCVPGISNNIPNDNGGTTGLDGSFWWTSRDLGASIYDKNNPQMFTRTNVRGLEAVDKNGVVIGSVERPDGKYHLGCLRRADPNDPKSYVPQELTNYPSDYKIVTSAYGVYLAKIVPNLFGYEINHDDIYGDSYRLYPSTRLTGYYKIHTENGLCELQDDDYSLNDGMAWINEQYDIDGRNKRYWVTPTSDIFFGK